MPGDDTTRSPLVDQPAEVLDRFQRLKSEADKLPPVYIDNGLDGIDTAFSEATPVHTRRKTRGRHGIDGATKS